MECGHCSLQFRRLVGLGVMVAFLATVFAPAMAAAQAQPADSNAFSNKSIEKVVANTKPAAEKEVKAIRATVDPPKTQGGRTGSFFKTREGVAVLIVMAAGTGYALHSLSKDRIRGSIR